MTILGIDASSKAGSCALLADGVLVGEFFVNISMTHSQTLMPMVRSLLDTVGADISDIDVFAVSTGPGSFTGLRIGIASVKGMAMATGKPCAAVSTLEALAVNIAAFGGIAAPVMDARRSQVYTALFSCDGGAVSRLSEDSAISVESLHDRLAQYAPRPVMLVGDGAHMCAEAMRDLGHVATAPETLLHQRAGSVAVVAAGLAAEGRLCTAGELAPSYLRLPQAERERLARLER